jgi:hypothetical protein
MRADYATSDLISKVNSDWMNAVLVNPEFDRADPHNDDDGDLLLQPESYREQAMSRWPTPARPSTDSTGIDDPEPYIADVLMARSHRGRSVARRITERLALAVAALAVAWIGVRMAPEPQDVTNAVSVRETNVSPEPAAPVSTTELRPAWLSPEILYARSSVSVPQSAR